MECPFCHYHTTSEYNISLHVETSHPEFDHDSPFATTDDDSLSLARALQQEDQEVLNDSKLDGLSHPLALSFSDNEPPIDDFGYVVCPVCKEYVFLPDYSDHLEIHASLDDLSSIHTIATMIGSGPDCKTDSQPSLGRKRVVDLQSSHNIVQSAEKQKHKATLTGTVSSSIQTYPRDENVLSNSPSTPNKNGIRLGKRELGPFAYEKQMPKRLFCELKEGAPIKHVNKIGHNGRLFREAFVENECSGIIPVLAHLLALSNTLESAYLCHPSVQHVFKRKDHGGFCGYLNIQMQMSYIQGAKVQGHAVLGKRIPGILDIQDMIENAWDNGIGILGRLQTGGIKGSRKWIGTPEASAVYAYLEIPQQPNSFSKTGDKPAHELLLDFVEAYFEYGENGGGKILTTVRAPIYFQQPGHSLTIVGLECHKDGSRNLLVFDPGFCPSRNMQGLIGKRRLDTRLSSRDAEKLMRAYRRTRAQLQKYDSFETLSLAALPPSMPA